MPQPASYFADCAGGSGGPFPPGPPEPLHSSALRARYVLRDETGHELFHTVLDVITNLSDDVDRLSGGAGELPSNPRGEVFEWSFPNLESWDADAVRPLREAVAQRTRVELLED